MTAAGPGPVLLAHGSAHPGGEPWTGWVLPALVAVLPAVGYLVAAGRLRASGRRWSSARTASFLLGAVLAGAALSPAIEAGTAGGHMAQHLLLGMYAPVALVLGAPGSLLLAVLPVRGRRPIAAVLRARAVHLISHVAVAALLSVGGLYLLYLTPLYALSARSELVHAALHLHFLVSGYLYAWAVAGPDPAPRRPGMGVRLAVLVGAGGAHAFLAKLLVAHAPALPPGGGHGVAEIERAAQWMYYGGHLGELVLLVALFAAWYGRTGRTGLGVRSDRRLPVGTRAAGRG